MMYDREKSDSAIVAGKPTNKAVPTDHRRQVTNACAGEKRECQAGKVVHRQVWLKCQRFLIPPVDMYKCPAAFWPPVRERNQPMAKEVPRSLGGLATLQIGRARHQLMPIGQNLPRDERRILQGAEPKCNIDTVGDVIDVSLGNQNLHAHVGVACLERGDEWA